MSLASKIFKKKEGHLTRKKNYFQKFSFFLTSRPEKRGDPWILCIFCKLCPPKEQSLYFGWRLCINPVLLNSRCCINISKHLNNNNKINCLTLSSDFYLGCQGKVDVVFQNEVKTLIHIITETRNRHASSHIHTIIDSVTNNKSNSTVHLSVLRKGT